MGKIWLPGGGGGGDGSDDCTIILPDVPKGLKAVTADSDDEAREGTLDTATTAADSHVLSGESYMKFNSGTKHWEKRTGAQANRGAWNARIGVNGKVAIPAGNHNGAGYVDQAITDRGAWTGSVGMNGSAAVPEGYHNGSGKVNGPAVTQRGAWAANIGINGRAVIPEGYHNGGGYVGQSVATKGAQTFTPGRTNQTIGAGQYLTGAQTILGDSNLVAGNIKKNVSIMGVLGSFQGTADSPIYLAKESSSPAVFRMDVTNGFRYYAKLVKDTHLSASVSHDYNGRYMQTSCEASPQGWYEVLWKLCDKEIYLDAYSIIRFKITTANKRSNDYSHYQRIGVNTNGAVTGNSFNAFVDLPMDLVDGVYELDVRSLSGGYWFYIWQSVIGLPSRGSFDSVITIYEVSLWA